MKKLITYFSASFGNTKTRAEELAMVTGADLKEIKPAAAYTQKDLDWRDKHSRSTVEMQDPSSRPDIVDGKVDLSGYDQVYIGFPIWWGVAPREINTFIEQNDFGTKQVVIFATSGGSGVDNAVRELQKTYPQLDIIGGKLLNSKVTKDIV